MGLYFAGLCQAQQIDYTVFEAAPSVGGQLMQLYPQKIITNIPGIPSITAQDYITQLTAGVDPTKILLGQKVTDLTTIVKSYDKFILATGKGEFRPRRLTDFSAHFEQNVCNILYSLSDYTFLTGKRVVVFGGGDSALDWAKQLSEICKVTLVHRRPEFRGNGDTIAACRQLTVLKPFVLKKIDVSKFQKTVTVETAPTYAADGATEIHIDYDYILVNFGVDLTPNQIEVSTAEVYRIGDCTGSSTIAAGLVQADAVFAKIIGE